MYQELKVALGNETLHIYKIGTGPKVLIAFHGYGLDGSVFIPFESAFKDYTIYAPDLPFHGKSNWHAPHMSLEDIKQLIAHCTKNTPSLKINLMGYSLGGKICMNLIQHYPQEIEQVILLAPDGLEHNKVFDFATFNTNGKKLFRYAVSKPQYFISTLNVLKRIKVIPKRNHAFYVKQLSDRKVRFNLYKIWNSFSLLRHDIPTVIQKAKKYHIPIILIMGKNDRLIKINIGRQFARKIPHIHFIELDKGHKLLDETLITTLQKLNL